MCVRSTCEVHEPSAWRHSLMLDSTDRCTYHLEINVWTRKCWEGEKRRGNYTYLMHCFLNFRSSRISAPKRKCFHIIFYFLRSPENLLRTHFSLTSNPHPYIYYHMYVHALQGTLDMQVHLFRRRTDSVCISATEHVLIHSFCHDDSTYQGGSSSNYAYDQGDARC